MSGAASSVGHVELAERWVNRPVLRPAYNRSLGAAPQWVREVGSGDVADFAMKGSVLALSVGALTQAEAPLTKIIFGAAAAISGAVLLASIFEATV